MVITGYLDMWGEIGYNAFLAKIADQTGELVWLRTFGSEECEVKAYSLIQAPAGGFIMAGSIMEAGSFDLDILLIGTDENGDSLWSLTREEPFNNDVGFSMSQTSTADFVLSGVSENHYAGHSWLMKLAYPTSSVKPTILNKFEFCSIYPNPFNAQTFLTFTTNDIGEEIKIFLYDITGRQILNVIQAVAETGEVKICIDGKSLPSGKFFVQVKQGGNNFFRPLIHLK